jgi:hypothetical protein
MWAIAMLACCGPEAKEEALRTCLTLSLRLEQAALEELQELLQCCRYELQGVHYTLLGSWRPGRQVLHLPIVPSVLPKLNYMVNAQLIKLMCGLGMHGLATRTDCASRLADEWLCSARVLVRLANLLRAQGSLCRGDLLHGHLIVSWPSWHQCVGIQLLHDGTA